MAPLVESLRPARPPRRSLLALALAASLAGCGARRTSALSPDPTTPFPDSSPPAASPTPSETNAPVSAPPESVSPSPTPSAASAPTRDEIAARYSGASPAWFDLEGEGIVSRTPSSGVCLTLDACGGAHGSGVDEDLVSLLLDRGIPFTAFLNSRWVEANPATLDRLLASGIVEIGNHGTAHLPLSVTGQSAYGIAGTTDAGQVYDEIMGCQELLTSRTGTAPRFFRPGTAHWDDVSVAIAHDLGVEAAGFSINADAGVTFSAAQVSSELRRAGAGDVVISHMNQPAGSTAEGYAQAIPALMEGGTVFLTLGQAIPAPA